MPEATLKALANHKELGSILPADGGDCEEVLARFADAGIDVNTLAARLQEQGAKSFVQSWELESDAQPKLEHDSSTNNLIRRYRKLKESAQ